MEIKELYKKKLQRLQEALSDTYTNASSGIKIAVEKIDEAFANGNKLIVFGNGGSAAQAQHFTAEFIGLLGKHAVAITTDSSNITSIGNDYGFQDIFARQIEAIGKKGDVAIAISTSGSSGNVLMAINRCKNKGIFVIGLTGEANSELSQTADYTIKVASYNTQTIQEAHQVILHSIFEAFYGN